MSSEKDQRLDGIFRSMKVPGFDKPNAPSADPRLLAPMVVEVDLLTNRIKRVETQAHDSPEHVQKMLQALIDNNAAAALERATSTASIETRGPTAGAHAPMGIQPASKSGRFLSDAIEDYLAHLTRQDQLSANTIEFTHAPSLRIFRELISEKRNLFGDAQKRQNWDIRLHLITVEKMNRFLEQFWKFPSRQGKRPGIADAKELMAIGGAPQSRENTINRLRHIQKMLDWLGTKHELDPSIPGQIKAELDGVVSHRHREKPQVLDIDEEAQDEDGYVAFSQQELKKIFNVAVYTAHAAGQPARFWIPLLGRYTGGRLNELAQATVRDIRTRSGLPCLCITSLERDEDGSVVPVLLRRKRVKTIAGRRTIPLHPELIRLGFLDYVQERVSGGHRFLFDLKWTKKDSFGKYPGRDFSLLTSAVGVWQRRRKVFHSFRSSLTQALADARLESSLNDRFLGHTAKSIREKNYNRNDDGTTMPLHLVYEALCKIPADVQLPTWSQVRGAERRQLSRVCEELGFMPSKPPKAKSVSATATAKTVT